MASGVVNTKVASGSQNLSGGLHQENVAANALMHLAKISFSYDDASGSPVVTKKGDNILYQKVGPKGEHLKFGITKNPNTRYTKEQLGGGRLKEIARGDKKEMLSLERKLHKKLPIGSEEGQKFYIRKQVEQGLKPPPYGN